MKKCVECGAKLEDTAVLCKKCGSIQTSYVPGKAIAVPAKPKSAGTDAKAAVVPAAPARPAVQVEEEAAVRPSAPACQLKTNRGLLKMILLSAVTFGIYGIVVMSDVSMDINIIAGRYDGKRTMSYCLMVFAFSWLTLGIAPLVWGHRLCNRIGSELSRRGISYKISAGTFWGWGIFGSLILVGPFIYSHKLLKSMNLLAAHYNVNG